MLVQETGSHLKIQPAIIPIALVISPVFPLFRRARGNTQPTTGTTLWSAATRYDNYHPGRSAAHARREAADPFSPILIASVFFRLDWTAVPASGKDLKQNAVSVPPSASPGALFLRGAPTSAAGSLSRTWTLCFFLTRNNHRWNGDFSRPLGNATAGRFRALDVQNNDALNRLDIPRFGPPYLLGLHPSPPHTVRPTKFFASEVRHGWMNKRQDLVLTETRTVTTLETSTDVVTEFITLSATLSVPPSLAPVSPYVHFVGDAPAVADAGEHPVLARRARASGHLDINSRIVNVNISAGTAIFVDNFAFASVEYSHCYQYSDHINRFLIRVRFACLADCYCYR